MYLALTLSNVAYSPLVKVRFSVCVFNGNQFHDLGIAKCYVLPEIQERLVLKHCITEYHIYFLQIQFQGYEHSPDSVWAYSNNRNTKQWGQQTACAFVIVIRLQLLLENINVHSGCFIFGQNQPACVNRHLKQILFSVCVKLSLKVLCHPVHC